MPGGTIGINLNPFSEAVWQGHIEITRVGAEYKVRYQYTKDVDATIDKLVRERIDEVVQGLNSRKK